eukprot:SAG22_NODE_639_length_8255_cov_13.659882_12_plen_90_part_00
MCWPDVVAGGDPAAKRTWSGLGGFPGKAMLSKFGNPARTHLVELFASKGANFDPTLQDVAGAVPNVVSRAASAEAVAASGPAAAGRSSL